MAHTSEEQDSYNHLPIDSSSKNNEIIKKSIF